ncbi:nucleotide sugar dehydrogenase [Candidatus Woesearchaeota archaeon]|nr:nucleotide sugar dehydrogenase [Candidatus Woesearchaeota archaeon]
MQNSKICIVGLGYVGLPLACLCAKKAFTTFGYDINNKVIEELKKGETIINEQSLKEKLALVKDKITFSSSPQIIKEADVVVVCVPTPINEQYRPNLEPLISSIKTVKQYIKPGALIILESTIFPGTSEEVVLPLLKPLLLGTDFYLAHCPERIDPGNKTWNISNIPRVVGGITEECSKKATELYKLILDADVLQLNSIKAAEATKIMENSFRDVNIAFMNEMAKSFQSLGIDISEVIKAASTKPFAFMPHYPGCGVGGHCIPVDPYYLIEKAKQSGFDHKFLALARDINNSMPLYTVNLIVDGLNKAGKAVNGSKILILGLAYKPNVNDMRESPSFEIIKQLKKKGANLIIFDPHVLEKSDVVSLDEVKECDCVVLVTSHHDFKKITPDVLMQKQVRVVVDGRNFFDKQSIVSKEIIYKGIGR